MPLEISRDDSWTLLCAWTESDSLRRHMLAVHRRPLDAGGAEHHLIGAAPVHLYPEVAQELEHRLDVANPRDIAQHDLVLGEEACCKHGQRGVLVARRDHRA